jgi:hypothetical protein
VVEIYVGEWMRIGRGKDFDPHEFSWKETPEAGPHMAEREPISAGSVNS